MKQTHHKSFTGVSSAAILIFALAGGCAGNAPGSPPRLLVESTRGGRAWPYGESGRESVRRIEETSTDPRYGWTHRKPVGLGGFDARGSEEDRFERQIRFLNSLWGPNGETIFYERIGTCCSFQFFGAPLDKGMLDVYSLTWEGQKEPMHLYLDGFREGAVKIPRGLTSRIKSPSPPDRRT
jgi:hypothetical protein